MPYSRLDPMKADISIKKSPILVIIPDVSIFAATLLSLYFLPRSKVQVAEKARNKVYEFGRIQCPVIDRNFDEINDGFRLHARVSFVQGTRVFPSDK